MRLDGRLATAEVAKKFRVKPHTIVARLRRDGDLNPVKGPNPHGSGVTWWWSREDIRLLKEIPPRINRTQQIRKDPMVITSAIPLATYDALCALVAARGTNISELIRTNIRKELRREGIFGQ